MVALKDSYEKETATWEIDDCFSTVRALRIFDPTGEPTEFSMVYSKQDGEWGAVRPVSDRYHPIGTEDILNMARERFGQRFQEDRMVVKRDRNGAMLKIEVPFDDPLTLTNKPAFDAQSRWTAFGDTKTKGEVIQPTFILKNSYDGSTGIQCYIGWVRMICSNGLISMDGLQMRSIHTKHQVSGFIDQVATMDYTGQYEAIKGLLSKKLSALDLKKIQESLPVKYRKEMTEYMKLSSQSDYLEDNSAYAALNFITYLQSNVYALSRSGQLNKAIKNVYKMAA